MQDSTTLTTADDTAQEGLVQDPWFLDWEAKAGWAENGNAAYIDFAPDRGTKLNKWRTGVLEGSANNPISLYRRKYSGFVLPPKAPRDAGVVDLNGFGAQGYVEQDIRTAPGTTYTLSFWLGYDMFSGTGIAKVAAQVSAINADTQQEIAHRQFEAPRGGKQANNINNEPGWKQHTLKFKAESDVTTIRLADWTGPANGSNRHEGLTGADITGVSVVEDSAPISLSPGGDVTLRRGGSPGYPGVRVTASGDHTPPQTVKVTLPGGRGLHFVGEPDYRLTVLTSGGHQNQYAGTLSEDGQTLTFDKVDLGLAGKGTTSTLWLPVSADGNATPGDTSLTFRIGGRSGSSSRIHVTG
ncbi:DUF642 domain-containing protein [Streptomyces sp. NPDC046939]|uniref:DUF642 domain-containing protein n=1 Tax=Streptomyces sp. NPDC046939 TaxID=3155376 RepID=UPI0034074080